MAAADPSKDKTSSSSGEMRNYGKLKGEKAAGVCNISGDMPKAWDEH